MLSSSVNHFVNIMAFMILALLLVVCVAQNIVSAGIFNRDKPADETELLHTESFGIRSGNPYLCIVYIPETLSVIKEFHGLWTEYQEVSETLALMRALCDKIDDEGSKGQCYKTADQTYADKTSEIVKKVQPIIPRLLELAKKYKKCLTGE